MQSFRQWIERELTIQRELLKVTPSTDKDRLKTETRIASYRKVLKEWIDRGERA